MTLSDELYFEITVSGPKAALKKFAGFLKSGELDEFFEISSDYIIYDDEYADTPDDGESCFVFSNDDLGIEIGEFDPEDFLSVFCKAGKDLDIDGHFYDLNDEEYSFTSPIGDDSFDNGAAQKKFNDELDEEAFKEEFGEE